MAQTNADCDPTRSVQVSGSATVEVVPDEVFIRLGIQAKENTAELAQPTYDNYENKNITGFVVNYALGVVITDSRKANDVIAAAFKAGANEVQNVEFRTSQLRKHRDEARVAAMTAAAEKAQLLAKAGNAQIGCTLKIDEASAGSSGPFYRNSLAQNSTLNATGNAQGDSSELPISLGTIAKLQYRAMLYTKLGNTGLKVSELCLGTMTFLWTADEQTSFDILSAFTSAGGNFMDTADIYSRWAAGNPGGTAEQVMGRWLKATNTSRDQVIWATKGGSPMGDGPNEQGASRVHLVKALEDSLRRMQTDYTDLYQIHWPDYDTPHDETLRALDDLVSSGKVRYVGASNYPAWWLMKSLWVSDARNLVRFECLQPHYNLMHRAEFERELLPLCKDQKIGVIPYSPLAGGYLTGKYRQGQAVPGGVRGENNARFQQWMASESGEKAIGKLEEIGSAHHKSIAQTALAWMLSNPVITAPIIGANTVAQLNDALGAAEYRLSEDEVNALNAITAWS